MFPFLYTNDKSLASKDARLKILKSIIKALEAIMSHLYGISKSQSKIDDYIYHLSHKNTKLNTKNNIIIHNCTQEQDNIDNLLEFLLKNLKKNKMIKGKKQTIMLDTPKELKEWDGKSDFLVLYPDEDFRYIDRTRENILAFVKENPHIVVVIVDNGKDEDIKELRGILGRYFPYFFKVEDSSELEKKQKIKNILQRNHIKIASEELMLALSRKPLYEVDSALSHIIIRCQKKHTNLIDEHFIKKELQDVLLVDDSVYLNNPIEDELESIIGMEKVKEQIEDIINYIKTCKERNQKRPSMHMAFIGPPGVGKTSMARIVAKMLKREGILSKGEYIELNARDVIGQYVGSTAIKTKKIIDQAKGGVLFLDESYSLDSRWDKGFEDEALAVIVQAMENYRDDLIIIFAGYEKQMQSFINRNPGLKSRIPFIIHFENYTSVELYKIFEKMAKEEGYYLSPSAKPLLMNFFDLRRKNGDFANGRECRNLIEKARIIQAKRVSLASNAKKNVITKSDVEKAIQSQPLSIMKKRIGFMIEQKSDERLAINKM